jgi:hypothetical protein
VLSSGDVAALRQLDRLVDGLNWPLVLTLIRPSFQPPQWNYVPGSDGAARLTDPCDIWDCLKWACGLYDAAIAAAGQQYNADVDAAYLDFYSDMQVNLESYFGFMAIFAEIGFGGSIGGASVDDWSEYINGFEAQNWSELSTDLANARNALKNRVCTAINDLKARVAWCVQDCPEYAWLTDFLDSYFGASGC